MAPQDAALLKVSPIKVVVESSPKDKGSVRKVSQLLSEEAKEDSAMMTN